MPHPAAQPEAVSALFPEVLPPQRGRVSDRTYKRRYIPKTYTPEEVSEARRVIGHWNQRFAGLEGAHRANPGDACNTKAYVRMLRKAARSEGLFAYIDEPLVKRAIDCYRTDAANNRLGRWKRFVDWCHCENIDFYRSKIKVTAHRREQPKAARSAADKRAAIARDLVNYTFKDQFRLGDLCQWAASERVTLAAFIERSLANDETPPGPCEALAGLLALARCRDGLPAAAREALSTRARKAFDCHFRRPIGRDARDPARLDALELALMDRWPQAIAHTQPPVEAGEPDPPEK